MRSAIIFLALCICFALVSSKPADKKAKSGCPAVCPYNYDPVCAEAKTGAKKQLSFGNECVLNTYNCEHPNEEYAKKSGGECPGATGIRLS